MNELQGRLAAPGSVKAWFRQQVPLRKRGEDAEDIWRLCARARTTTVVEEHARIMLQLLGLGHLADPGLNQATADAVALLNGQEGAPLRLPVLDAGHPQEIINWCRYILTQPMERTIELSRPLHPVMGNLTPEGAVAVGQVLRWAMFGERPEPR